MRSYARALEARLLAWALAVGLAALGAVHLALYRSGPPGPLFAAAGALAGFGVVHLAMRRWGHRGDEILLPLVAFLAGLGLAVLYRLDPELMVRQSLWLVLGQAGCLAVIRFGGDLLWLRRWKNAAAAAGALLLAAAAAFGVERGGTRQWLDVAGISFEPSDLVKILMVIFLAAYLAERRGAAPTLPAADLVAPLGVGIVVLGLLVVQRDLGTTALYYGIFLALFYAATGRARIVIAAMAVFAAGILLAAALLPHVRLRVEVWLDPWADLAGRGYQTAQALFALGSGGIAGTGLGFGHPELVPAVPTDLILVALGEELGYLGAVTVLVAYLVLIARGTRAAMTARSVFEAFLAMGITATLGLEVLAIAGGSIRAIPLTGLPLPFVSYGGSSMVTGWVMLALLLVVSHHGRRSAPEPV